MVVVAAVGGDQVREWAVRRVRGPRGGEGGWDLVERVRRGGGGGGRGGEDIRVEIVLGLWRWVGAGKGRRCSVGLKQGRGAVPGS